MTTLSDNGPTAEATSVQTGCAVKPANLPRAKPISVSGVAIARDAIARETQNHPAEKPIEAWLAAARALVVRELLLQEARRLAIVPAPVEDGEGRFETDDEALVRQLVEQEVVTPQADEATCRRIYDAQTARFRSTELYAVRHILFAAAPDDDAGRTIARANAEATIASLVAAPDRFAEFAVQHSACPSRTNGGQLGQVSRGQTVPEFEAALAHAPVGTVCPGPVETRYGLHVIQVDQRIAGRQLPFEAVHRQIAAWLEDRAQHTAIRQYIGLLAGRATILGISLDEETSPLAQ